MLFIIWHVVFLIILLVRRRRERGPIGKLMPTNRLVDAVLFTRKGHKWGIPTMLLATPYLLIAVYCRGLLDQGGEGWLNLIVLYGIWNTLKITAIGPISLGFLAYARIKEYIARKKAESQAARQAGIEVKSSGVV